MDWSNYAKKADLKGTTDIDTSRVISKTNLISWKTKVDLTMISNEVKNVYDKSITKVSSIDTKRSDTSRLVTKMMYDSEKIDLEEKEWVAKWFDISTGL